MEEEIRRILKGEVLTDEASQIAYSRDASFFEIKPKIIVYPKDSEDIKNLVKWVAENKSKYPDLSITARAAGTDMSGGPLNDSIILDLTKHMNKLISFDPEKREITVEPGMYYRDFEKITTSKNLMLPSYPASKSICAIGGMVGNNAGGEKSLRYGKTEEYIERLKIVLADGNEYEIKNLTEEELQKKIALNNFEGNLYKNIRDLIQSNQETINKAKPKVSKNSSGYYIWNVWQEKTFNLNKLIVGSQGSLGVVTEVTFKLVPIKKYSKLLVIFLKDLNYLASLVNVLLKTGPESLESYDDKTLFIVLRYFGGFIKLLGSKNIFLLLLQFWPEFKMIISQGFPKLVILAEFTGDDSEFVFRQVKEAEAAARSLPVQTYLVKNEKEKEKYWTIRREAFNLIRFHLKKKKSIPFIDDLIVKPEKLPEFLPKLYKILSQYKKDVDYALGGHVGDGNFHIYTLMDPTNPKLLEIVSQLSQKVYDLVISLGGSITAEHNDGLIRTPYLEKMFGSKVVNLFKEIKNIFDPKNLFNPGKKVGNLTKS